MTFSYNRAYDPPIPSLDIVLTVPDSGNRIGPLSAIVDTGADGTLVPMAYLKELGAVDIDEAWLSSHWGEWRQVVLYLVDIQIEGEMILTLPGLYVVGDDDGQEIILGRNVLNKLSVHLNGPALLLQVSE